MAAGTQGLIAVEADAATEGRFDFSPARRRRRVKREGAKPLRSPPRHVERVQ